MSIRRVLDAIIQAYEDQDRPAQWCGRAPGLARTDPVKQAPLLDDATRAVQQRSSGHVSRVGDPHLAVTRTQPQRHNMVVCTLCPVTFGSWGFLPAW
jgi:nitrile hydratase